ncbi:glutathione peroxidase [Mucilaginibacter flavus]|uniref:glutathione peroxidase n=1 Tax=Mucilaginibacter flavus TaxID=931504 RepID=UPI0025B2B4CA|nr:glutathione peroxidase [Mucilaginibacter flavus]MDN3581169.1 glutathione peroxidase [Mucilaginibacter flavus]
MDNSSVHKFNVQKLNGDDVSLSAYKNKVLLIVNTASQCGFTPQLKDLAELKETFKDADFEILAFPSNDFGGQEPLDGAAIAAFCESSGAKNFPIFDKIRVRGSFAHPLYQFLANKKENGKLSSVPRWNFHKFLIDRDGHVTDFYYPFTKPTASKIRKKIERLLAAAH